MEKLVYVSPYIKAFLFTEAFIRTSPENDAEFDGDDVYGGDGWKEQ